MSFRMNQSALAGGRVRVTGLPNELSSERSYPPNFEGAANFDLRTRPFELDYEKILQLHPLINMPLPSYADSHKILRLRPRGERDVSDREVLNTVEHGRGYFYPTPSEELEAEWEQRTKARHGLQPPQFVSAATLYARRQAGVQDETKAVELSDDDDLILPTQKGEQTPKKASPEESSVSLKALKRKAMQTAIARTRDSLIKSRALLKAEETAIDVGQWPVTVETTALPVRATDGLARSRVALRFVLGAAATAQATGRATDDDNVVDKEPTRGKKRIFKGIDDFASDSGTGFPPTEQTTAGQVKMTAYFMK